MTLKSRLFGAKYCTRYWSHVSLVMATYLPGGGGYSHTLPIRVCAAQRGRDFEAPDLERGIKNCGSRLYLLLKIADLIDV